MTDDERAEQAFKDAFAGRADALEPVVLEASTHGRRRWPAVAAAAAAVVLVAGVTTGVVTGSRSGVPDGTAAPGPTVPQTPAATGGAVTPIAPDSSLPPAAAGWHWVSRQDVAVQVPDSWGYDRDPIDACNSTKAAGPYVTLDPRFEVIAGVGCSSSSDGHPSEFGSAPESLWSPHLEFESGPSSGARILTYHQWTQTTEAVGSMTLQLLTDTETAPLTEQILDSARTFDVDANGCDATSPIQAERFVRPSPFDVTDVHAVDSISLCLYPRTGTGAPGLSGSRLLSAGASAELLAGIQGAPVGGGPNAPQNCTHDEFGDTGIVVRLHSGATTHDLYAYLDWCFGNGIDDGTQQRELTHADCEPLIEEDPVVVYSGSTEPFSRCHG